MTTDQGQVAHSNARWPRPLRVLALSWAVVAVLAGAGVATLLVLGPPPRPHATAAGAPAAHPPALAHAPPDAHAAPVAVAPSVTVEPVRVTVEPARVTVPRAAGSPITLPDTALLESSPGFAPATLPRIAADGQLPRVLYAAGADPPDHRPRVAMVIAGIGMSGMDSEAAVAQLPAAVSLAITPYAPRSDRLLDLARAAGHELFVSLALEPSRYPLDDPGPQTLLTTLSATANAQRLEWTLSRFDGYAGAIGALGVMRGERYAGSDQMRMVLQELAHRGLAYVDPRPDGALANAAAPLPAMRRVDVVVDEPAVRVEIEARLARLEQVARDRGTAVGLAGAPAPVTLDRIAAWSATLAQRGIVLVPVTSILAAPRAITARRSQ